MIVRPRGLVAALVFLAAAAAPLAAQQKVGFVDTSKLLAEMPGRAQAEAGFRAEVEKLGLREKRMTDSLQALMAAFERDSAKLAQPEKVTRFTALQAYDAQYRDTIEVLQAEAQQKQREAMAPLFEVIRIALEDVRQAEGFSMIFDVAAQVNPIVAMDKNLDLSDRVMARIRTMPAPRPATTTAPAAATPPRPTGPVSQPSGVTRKP